MGNKANSRTEWSRAASELLDEARVPQRKVAELLKIKREGVTPYLNGARTPSPDTALRLNAAIAKATKDKSAVGYLDCLAIKTGLVPVERVGFEGLAFGVDSAVAEMCGGFLSRGWERRVTDAIYTWDEDRLLGFALAINIEHRRLLRKSTTIPWKAGVEAIKSIFEEFGIKGVITISPKFSDRVGRFQTILRRELKRIIDPSTSARDLHAVEARILGAALVLGQSSNKPRSLAAALAGEETP